MSTVVEAASAHASSPCQKAARPRAATSEKDVSETTGGATATAEEGDRAEEVEGEGANEGTKELAPLDGTDRPGRGRSQTRPEVVQRLQANKVGPGHTLCVANPARNTL